MSLISKDLQRKTRGAILFVVRVKSVSVATVEVRRDVGGSLSSQSKKWELVVGGM